jgi:hypothetical protein
MIGIFLVHLTSLAKDKIKLRAAMTSSLKHMKTELQTVLDFEEQTLNPISLMPDVLQNRINSPVKLE